MSVEVELKNVRVGQLSVYEAVEYEKGDGKFRYNLTAIITPGSANAKLIDAAIAAEATRGWGADAKAKLNEVQGVANKLSYTSGNGKKYDGYEGNMILRAYRHIDQGAPRVYAADGKTLLSQPSNLPYKGCYVNLFAQIYYMHKGKVEGIFCSFSDVQFSKHGEAFGGGYVAAGRMANLEEGADAENLL